ncbi:MarR family winged helix-turn-helix transcriptional regulator [Enterococcus pingfangensis]|uniref:MarR family winged helix-turn-helix transcriptional regulator n=1 Tax=Enterococcus pingfangensis TaxID=2559924 RepID=UPI0010F84CCE|nr:MarR family transcriptional regulator [Enterococcus pingfangensis]
MHQFYERCAYFTAARYMRAVDKLTIDIFKPTGMAPAYSYIMFYLEDYGEVSITDVAAGLGYERTTVSRLVNKLEKEQLVYFNYHGRKSMVLVSDKGKQFLISANQCLDELKKTTDDLLGETKKEMTDLLTINYQKLEGKYEDDQL